MNDNGRNKRAPRKRLAIKSARRGPPTPGGNKYASSRITPRRLKKKEIVPKFEIQEETIDLNKSICCINENHLIVNGKVNFFNDSLGFHQQLCSIIASTHGVFIIASQSGNVVKIKWPKSLLAHSQKIIVKSLVFKWNTLYLIIAKDGQYYYLTLYLGLNAFNLEIPHYVKWKFKKIQKFWDKPINLWVYRYKN